MLTPNPDLVAPIDDQKITLKISSVTPDAGCGDPDTYTYSPATVTITLKGVPAPGVDAFCDCSDSLEDTDGPETGVITPNEKSGVGVQYGTGAVSPRSPALLASSGYGGFSTGVDLATTNMAGFDGPGAGSAFGTGMISSDLPSLEPTVGTGFAAVQSAGNAIFFSYNSSGPSAGTFSPMYFNQDTLTQDSGSDSFLITQSDGTSVDFYGLGGDIPTAQKGAFKSSTDSNGGTTTTTYNTSGQMTSLTQSDSTSSETYHYSYLTTGVNIGLVSNVTLTRTPSGGSAYTVQQVGYSYYGGTGIGADSFGDAGDLKTETLEDANGSPIGTTYFRYYVAGELTTGYLDALRYQFNPQSYARLVAAYGDPTTTSISDSDAAPFADQYYEYDANQRVTKTIVQGAGCSCSVSTGQGTYTYSYVPNTTATSASDYNAWVTQTTETLPDGNKNVVYSNVAGEVILTAFDDISDDSNTTLNGKVWTSYNQFDSQGRLVLAAQPSAVAVTTESMLTTLENDAATANSANPNPLQPNTDVIGYSSTAGTYQFLNASSGLINLVSYGGTTTATATTAGDVLGYLQTDAIENGYTGTPILQDSTQYLSHTDSSNSTTVYPVATSTVYRNTDGTGTETTTDSYTWFNNSDRMQSMTVTAPVISTTQDGPGTADVTTTVFDAEGRAIWTKDGDGYLTYTAYDHGTGSVIKTITDVNTALSSEYTNLPSGWSTPIGGGLNLITTDQVDGQGRTTEETSPNGNVTYTFYDDPNHEVRVYPGWNATSGTTTGPTQVTREDWPGSYSETLTMTAAPVVSGTAGSYVPTGAEAISGITTLSRTYTDNANRATKQDDYFNLSGVTYSTAASIGTPGTSYYETTYGYDERGRQNLVDNAVGTITITKFDSLGRAATVYVGTNDTGFWTGGSTSNMLLVSSNQYDNGGVGDGNQTATTQNPDSSSADARITLGVYDWRDRLVATKSGDQLNATISGGVVTSGIEDTTTHRPVIFYTLDNLGETTAISQYDGDNFILSTTAPSSSLRRAYVTTAYDDQGRAYQQQQYEVNPSTGALSTTALTTTTYYDHRGDTIAVYAPGGLVTKDQYDGAGRMIVESQTDGAGGTTWANAGSIASDHVLTETLTTYDGDGNAILVTTEERDNNATGVGSLAASTPPVAVGDYGFEAVSVGTGNYVYDPTGSPWTFSTVSGVVYDNAGFSGNGSLFTSLNPNAPQGVQVAFLQENGSISQSISGWSSGTYTLSFDAAQRAYTNAASQDFEVLVDGNVVGTFTPSGTSYQVYTTAPFAVTAGSHTVEFLGLDTAGGDNTAFLDQIQIASAPPTVVDAGFESPSSTYAGSGGYSIAPTGSPWAYSGTAGLSANGTAFTGSNPSAPQGTQVAFIQAAGSISQSVAGWTAGTYTISFDAAQRAYANVAVEDFEVLIDGNVVGTFTPSSTSYLVYTTSPFTVTAGSHTVEFLGLDSAGGDNTVFLDQVQINPPAAARVSYMASYYDIADRLTASVDMGTNGGLAYTRPSSPVASSATALVITYQYNPSGWVDLVTDPRGILAETDYDLLGRTTRTVAAYSFSGPAPSGTAITNSTNSTTAYTYDGLGHILTVTAVVPSGSTNQTTTYAYGVTTADGSLIDDNDWLASTTQPGVSYTGASATTTVTYDALGDVLTSTDPNGTTHTYAYDVLGRVISDAVTTLGTGVDGSVRLITTAYDTQGNAYLFTSYSATTGGSIVNQVEDVFNGLGQLTGQYQAVGGAVSTSTTPEIQYAYTEMSGGQNNSRPTSMTYPNGRVIDYVYNSGLDSAISRLSAIADDSSGSPGTVLESYAYLGLGMIVAWNHAQSGVNLTYLQQAGDTSANTTGGDQYTGLDRFGRVIDQNWVNTSTGSSDVRYQYGYDQAGDVLYRADLVNTALSELYHANSSASGDNALGYDPLGRLTSFSRGTLSASGNNGTTLDTISSPSSSQSWSYDALGNQIGVTTNGTSVTQGFNTLDQQTSTTSGTAPTYDANGNTLTSGGLTYKYYAWNRLVGVSNTATSAAVATYAYDALGRRIEESYAGGSTNYLYYSSDWKVIEERQDGTAAGNVHYQYVWGESGNLILRDTVVSGSVVPADRLYTLWDANGDITAITNASGAVVERYEYSPYGVVTVLTASGSPVTGNASAYGWQYLFQGGRQDSATGLYIFEHRDYNPTSGTWMQRDPWGLAAGDADLYRFVSGNPISNTDPSGLMGERDAEGEDLTTDKLLQIIKYYGIKGVNTNQMLGLWMERVFSQLSSLPRNTSSGANKPDFYQPVIRWINGRFSSIFTDAFWIELKTGNTRVNSATNNNQFQRYCKALTSGTYAVKAKKTPMLLYISTKDTVDVTELKRYAAALNMYFVHRTIKRLSHKSHLA